MAELKIRAAALKVLQQKAIDYEAGPVPVDLTAARAFVNKMWNKFEQAHDTLGLVALDDAAEAAQIDLYLAAQTVHQKCLDFLVEPPPPPIQSPPPTVFSEARTVKLAPIKIKTFKGDKMKWLEFRDQFTSLVHNKDMDDQHKLALLREHAQVQMVEGSYTGGYPELWAQLCERFNDEFALAEAWYNEFWSIPIAKDTKTGLLSLIDATRAVLRAFNQMNNDISLSAHTLFGFLDRLPPNVRVAWGCARTETGMPALEACLNFIERRAKNMSESVTAARSSAPVPPPRAPRVHVATTAQLSPCACQGNHHRFKFCAAFKKMTGQQRRQFITNRGQCVRCFGDHLVDSCPSEILCYQCQGTHSNWFCLEPRGTRSSGSQPPPAMNPQNLPRH